MKSGYFESNSKNCSNEASWLFLLGPSLCGWSCWRTLCKHSECHIFSSQYSPQHWLNRSRNVVTIEKEFEKKRENNVTHLFHKSVLYSLICKRISCQSTCPYRCEYKCRHFRTRSHRNKCFWLVAFGNKAVRNWLDIRMPLCFLSSHKYRHSSKDCPSANICLFSHNSFLQSSRHRGQKNLSKHY